MGIARSPPVKALGFVEYIGNRTLFRTTPCVPQVVDTETVSVQRPVGIPPYDLHVMLRQAHGLGLVKFAELDSAFSVVSKPSCPTVSVCNFNATNLPPPAAQYGSSTMFVVGPEGSIIPSGAGLSNIAKTTFLVAALISLRIESEAGGCSKGGQYTVRPYVGQPQGRPNLPSPTILIRRCNWRSGECTERFKGRARGRVGAIYALFRMPRRTTLKTTCSLRSLH